MVPTPHSSPAKSPKQSPAKKTSHTKRQRRCSLTFDLKDLEKCLKVDVTARERAAKTYKGKRYDCLTCGVPILGSPCPTCHPDYKDIGDRVELT